MAATLNTPITLASAPGKVLTVGGYLVLDRNHTGLVVGTDTCLYAAVQTQETDKPLSAGNNLTVLVVSPQFTNAWWKYDFNPADNNLVQIDSAKETTNKFVEVVLRTALSFVNIKSPSCIDELCSSKQGRIVKIVLSADNDFYSQRDALTRMGLELSSESLRKVPRMNDTKCTLAEVHKTGLGSSAAMVTSLVAALLSHFGVVSASDSSMEKGVESSTYLYSQKLIHNMAQFAHCLAQGKIGSGFDVSSAVYGTHVYRRFTPTILDVAMENPYDAQTVSKVIDPSKNSSWDNEVVPVQIPPGFILRLADVDAGSSTPSMVKKILQWKKENPKESAILWSDLDTANDNIRRLWADLTSASVNDSDDYNTAMAWCRTHKSAEWRCAPQAKISKTLALMADLADGIKNVRALQQKLGNSAGVPVEPAEQTRLLDACMEVPGVCMAAVPGAGGYDAIYCVVLGDEPASAVEKIWLQWSEMSVGPLLSNQASGGVCILDPRNYPEITNHF